MIFTSSTFSFFLLIVFILYWSVPRRSVQNVMLLIASYLFYGWVHPWFCGLIALSTVIDYGCALGMEQQPRCRKRWLWLSLSTNIGMLGGFKYFNFFADNVQLAFATIGIEAAPRVLDVVLPVGISFYTFQTLSYTIDVYRGQLHARRNFVDFALFVAFFPQLVAGPIERASHFLPQVERDRYWNTRRIFSAVPLILTGYLKKLVVADNVSVIVDRIFLLEQPPLFLLAVGSFGFAIQIFADFSAYTDIARACARLLGFELMENFRAPYLAISPSDFWRRWHISFSSWIRDYVYIPLGGSKSESAWKAAWILMVTMALSGLWHGAAWNFVVWGMFHGLLLTLYHAVGCGGRWYPASTLGRLSAWLTMQLLIVFGWALFRAPTLGWIFNAVWSAPFGVEGVSLVASSICFVTLVGYALPWVIAWVLERFRGEQEWELATCRWIQVGVIALLANPNPQEFIYFQF
ncbi:Probable alginate O-acetylase AlgI [Chlamydiales bacterium SCGC AG-110-P3]|nr:Probable alginate O-acetylase AlgI [Chlamydiales bacterium SCGC AG-110-P3]